MKLFIYWSNGNQIELTQLTSYTFEFSINLKFSFVINGTMHAMEFVLDWEFCSTVTTTLTRSRKQLTETAFTSNEFSKQQHIRVCSHSSKLSHPLLKSDTKKGIINHRNFCMETFVWSFSFVCIQWNVSCACKEQFKPFSVIKETWFFEHYGGFYDVK